MSAQAAAAYDALAPATLPPDEMAVMDWMKIRLADLHARHGIVALTVTAHRYSSGATEGQWVLHKDGECVVGQRTIADGVKALREKLEARP